MRCRPARHRYRRPAASAAAKPPLRGPAFQGNGTGPPICLAFGGPTALRDSAPLEIFAAAPCLVNRPRLEHGPDHGGEAVPIWRLGEVAEWLNAPHSKCGIGASLSGVRIPPSPPLHCSPQYPIVRNDSKSND